MKSLVPEVDRRRFLAAGAAAIAAAGAVYAGPVGPFAAQTKSKDLPSILKFSVMLWTVEPKAPFDERIGKVSDAGYHAVELVEEYKGWSKDDFARARQRLHQLNMVVDACSGIDTSLCDPSQRDHFLAEIRAKLPVLAELECPRLILLSGNRVPGLSHEEMHASCVEGLKRAADVVAAQNIELLLENIDPEENPNYFLTSVAEGFDVVREVGNPHVRFLYDFYHEQVSEGNLLAKLEKNIDLTGLVHIADVPGRHEPGSGEINYANIFRKLNALRYSRYVAMEFIPRCDVVDALRCAREFAEKNSHDTTFTAAEMIESGGLDASS